MFIGQIILNRRKELNMTQKQLAEKLNVTDRTISRWECGVSLPDVEMLKTVAKVLEVDITYFYEDVKEKEINYTEEYDYEKIKKFKINSIIPFVLLWLKPNTFNISSTKALFLGITRRSSHLKIPSSVSSKSRGKRFFISSLIEMIYDFKPSKPFSSRLKVSSSSSYKRSE